MLSRGTLWLLVSAIALTGGVLLFENRSGSNPTDVADSANGADVESNKKLFPIEEEDIEAFTVTREADTTSDSSQVEELSFIKNDDNTWQMTSPEEAIAESGAIAFLLSQLTSATARPVTIEAETAEAEESSGASLEEFGLAEPDHSVSFTASNQEYLLYVGGLDFAGDKRYVQTSTVQTDAAAKTDPETSPETAALAANIYAVPSGLLNAVNRPTKEWLVTDETNAPATAEDSSAVDESTDVDESTTEESEEEGS